MKKLITSVLLLSSFTFAYADEPMSFKINNKSYPDESLTVSCADEECTNVTTVFKSKLVTETKTLDLKKMEEIADRNLTRVYDEKFGEIFLVPYYSLKSEYKNGYYVSGILKSLFLAPVVVVLSPAIAFMSGVAVVGNSSVPGKAEKNEAKDFLKTFKKIENAILNGETSITLRESRFSKMKAALLLKNPKY